MAQATCSQILAYQIFLADAYQLPKYEAARFTANRFSVAIFVKSLYMLRFHLIKHKIADANNDDSNLLLSSAISFEMLPHSFFAKDENEKYI